MHKTTLACLLAVAPALAHADADCTPSRLLIVLDKSSSMNDTVDATGTSKWSIAKQAITQVATTYENKIDLGINIFPNPNQCAPGKTVVTPGPGNASAIVAAFGADPPSGGNYTPMSQSIDAAAADASLADPTRRPTILLVTDGWQWCSPYDASTRSWPVGAVERAKAQGITVYVVGFGADVDTDTLNQMAVQGGTALAGCDPSDPNKKCYFQADSAADLLSALETVTISISTEICDGKDNDCNGLIDDGLSQDCSTACGAGTETCTLGTWGGCTAPTPSPEVCDGKDNDCNGSVDDNLQRDCSSSCGAGDETCVDGNWQGCTAPTSCECQPGDSQACSVAPQDACAPGPGTKRCQNDGTWGPCRPAVRTGVPEICNGIDDDCDGQIDNGPTEQLCPQGGTCVDGKCQMASGAAPSQPDGCGCKIGGGASGGGASGGDVRGGILMLALLAGLLLTRRRQRT